MKRLFCTLFVLLPVMLWAQPTPSQMLESAKSYQALSDRDLRVVMAYEMAQLLAATTPAAAISNASGWGSLSDRDLQIINAYYLSQLSSLIGKDSFTNGNLLNLALTNGSSLTVTGAVTAGTLIGSIGVTNLTGLIDTSNLTTSVALTPWVVGQLSTNTAAHKTLLTAGVLTTNAPAAGASLVYDGTNLYWKPLPE